MAGITEPLQRAKAYHRAGQLEPAEEIYRQVLREDPTNAQVYCLLAAVCQTLGKLDEAVANLRQAIRLRPDQAETHNHLGVTLVQQRNLREAIASFQQAVQLNPGHFHAYSNLGAAFRSQGKSDQAVWAYQRALQLKPDCADAYYYLGEILSSQGKFEEAEAAYRQAIHCNPAQARACVGLGHALYRQKKIDQSVACYQEALRLAPDSAELHASWATALLDLGRPQEAVSHLERALQIRPSYVPPYKFMGELFKEGRYRFSAERIADMKNLLKGGTLAVSDQITLNFALAYVSDKLGNYDEAFGYYRQGNELKEQVYQQRGMAFDIHVHRQFIEERIEAYTPELFERLSPLGHPSETPVFIVGVPRSGTTLVNHILSAHPDVTAPGEFLDIPNITVDLPRILNSRGKLRDLLPQLDRKTVHRLAERYLRHLTQLGGSVPRITDKLPENYFHLGLISVLFPKARIIHCRRNPLDTCVSCYMHDFRYVRFSTSLEALGLYYREYERLMAHWRRVLPVPMYEVQYEDLVARQEAVSRELIAYCGLEWNDCCLAFHENPRMVHTASRMQVRQPIYTTALKRWEKYAAYLGPLMAALGEAAKLEASPAI